MDKKTRNHILAGMVLFIIMLAAFVIWHAHSVKKVREECNQVNAEMSARITGATRTVYRALADISVGEIITDDLVSMDASALTDESQELLMSSDGIGKVATVNIQAGEMIKGSMVTELLEEEWQEVEYNCIWLSTNLKEYDQVDVRILYPDGTDYIVASKKSIRKLRLSSNNVFLWCTEDEILNIDSAIVDANLHGARIYTTRYVKPEIEKETITTYQPSANIIDLMNRDPNVLIEAKQQLSKSARLSMEEKLQQFKEDHAKQKADEEELGYDFSLDTTTNGGSNDKSDNNHGYTPSEEVIEDSTADPYAETGAVDSVRNEDVSGIGGAE